MTRTRSLTLSAALLVVVAVPLTASAESTAVSSRATVKVAFNKKLKKSILVDGRGLTLYMYVPDTPRQPACYNDATYHCSKAWPPLLTTGAPRGQGVKGSLLGTVKRKGGASRPPTTATRSTRTQAQRPSGSAPTRSRAT